MPSGWTRLEFENFEIPYEVVYPTDLDAGNLKSKFDVLILPSGAQIRGAGGATGGRGGGGGGGGGRGGPIPAEFQKMQGTLTPETTLPQLKQFLNDGGTIITVGSATSLGYALNLPIENHLLVRAPGQPDRALAGEEYYVPGSILRVAVDNTAPVAAGMPAQADVFFDNSPVFRLKPDASAKGVKAVAWFDSAAPLRSGWAWGQNYLEGGAAILEANYGKGKVYMFGPGDHVPRPAARHVQVPIQRHLCADESDAAGCAVALANGRRAGRTTPALERGRRSRCVVCR